MCSNVCRLCNRLVISNDVTFADNTLTVNIPAGDYQDGEKYCLVVAQNIPTDTTISAPVVVTIGEGTEQYPLDNSDCSQASACGLRTRTRYATRVATTPTGGAFRLLGRTCCAPNNDLASINGTAPTTTTGGGEITKGGAEG